MCSDVYIKSEGTVQLEDILNEFVVVSSCLLSVFSTNWQRSEPVVFSNPDQML